MFESLNVYKMIIVAFSLFFLYIVLRKLLFKPVTQFMENRTKSIKDANDLAAEAKSQAARLKQAYDDQLNLAREKGIQLMDEMRINAETEYKKILRSARQESESILKKGRAEIAHERELLRKEVLVQVEGLALTIASKVLESNMNTENNRALVKKIIEETDVA